MGKIKLIVWDWNGTLLNDVDVCITTINTLLCRYGYRPLSGKEEYRQKFQFPIVEYYKNVGVDFSRTPFEEMAAEYMDIYHSLSKSCSLQPESIATLAALREAGLRQVLLSASLTAHLRLQTERYPLSPYFEQFLGIENIYATSKAELAAAFVAQCGCGPDEIVFVGDSVHDWEVACRCGCRCVLYSAGHQSRDRLAATGVPVIDSLRELPCFVQHLGED